MSAMRRQTGTYDETPMKSEQGRPKGSFGGLDSDNGAFRFQPPPTNTPLMDLIRKRTDEKLAARQLMTEQNDTYMSQTEPKATRETQRVPYTTPKALFLEKRNERQKAFIGANWKQFVMATRHVATR